MFLSCFPSCSLQRAMCAYCADRIWGLGRQGYKCVDCKLLVHKKCHRLVKLPCGLPHVSRYILSNQCKQKLLFFYAICEIFANSFYP